MDGVSCVGYTCICGTNNSCVGWEDGCATHAPKIGKFEINKAHATRAQSTAITNTTQHLYSKGLSSNCRVYPSSLSNANQIHTTQTSKQKSRKYDSTPRLQPTPSALRAHARTQGPSAIEHLSPGLCPVGRIDVAEHVRVWEPLPWRDGVYQRDGRELVRWRSCQRRGWRRGGEGCDL